jgi:hypothetical protein
MLHAGDPQTYGRTFDQISVTRRNFSAIVAVPIQTESGRTVGVMTMNLESSVENAMAKLRTVKILEILKGACADAGNLVLS